jgi:hypothetical protein
MRKYRSLSCALRQSDYCEVAFVSETWESILHGVGDVSHWWVAAAWFAWWLWAVNWRKVWPVLAQGGWVVLLLIMITAALVWSELSPSTSVVLGFFIVANFWWQLGAVGFLVVLTLACGWIQDHFGWQPEEINLDPPMVLAESHAHSSSHGH